MVGGRQFTRFLDAGLPDLPDQFREGQPVPVASWIGLNFAALVVVEDCEHDEDCEPELHFVAMTYTFRRADGGWEASRVGGGTDWPGGAAPSVADALDSDEVLMEGGPAGSDSSWVCYKVDGFAGASASWVEMDEEGLDVDRRRLSPSGAFVAVRQTSGAATVRILDQDQQVLDQWLLPASA